MSVAVDTDAGLLSPAELADVIAQVPDVLREAGRCEGRYGARDLTALVQDVLDVLQTAEATIVALTRDALEQGVVEASTAAGPRDWIRRLSSGEPIDDVLGPEARQGSGPLVDHWGTETGTETDEQSCHSQRTGMPGIEPAHAGRLATVAQAVQPRRNAHLRSAVADGDVSVACAKTALQEVRRTQPSLKGSTREQVLGYYLDYTRELPSSAVAKDVKALSQRILAEYSDDGELDRTEHAAQQREYLDLRTTGDGMVRIEGQLSPDHGAILRHAITALSAPSPESSCCDNPHHRHTDGAQVLGPDLRSPSKRRADALVALTCKTAELIDGDGATTTSGTARIVVTMSHDRLLDAITRHQNRTPRPSPGVCESTRLPSSAGTAQLTDAGRESPAHFQTPPMPVDTGPPSNPWPPPTTGPPGVPRSTSRTSTGITDTGENLSPALTRALACDAEIIPMVLGSESEPLDVGRTRRLVPPGLRRAVIARDHHCTFPGCDRQPSWCQVHHIHPWKTGGRTSLANSTLLCQRHHTIVHRDGYTAHVTQDDVVWDLTRPGAL